MKKLIKPLYFFLAVAATLGACKKDEIKATGTTSGTSAKVSASLYGFDGGNSGKFTSTKASITQVTAGGLSTFTVSAIRDGGNEIISIVALKKITATGKIAFGPSITNGLITISKDYTKLSDLSASYTTDKSNPNGVKGGGELNVTKLDGNTIEGTFYAIAYNSAGKEAFVEQGTFSGTIVQ